MKKKSKFIVGRRTLKTAFAVVISMALVSIYGATTSKLIFAMLGAMNAMQPTFKESLEASLTQIIGVFLGAIIGVWLMALPIHPLISTGIGIILVISIYNLLKIRFSPSLSCLIVVTICTTADIEPFTYAFGRIWDTAIGLGVGMLINTLVFPYDNITQIHDTAKQIDIELIHFLKDMFDGDYHLPNTDKYIEIIDEMHNQLRIFSNQWQLMHLKNHKIAYKSLQTYEEKAHKLIAHMEVLLSMNELGHLNEQNQTWLINCGAQIRDTQIPQKPTDNDIVTNYHIEQVLILRAQLLEILNSEKVSLFKKS